jgi:3-oxoadipate enol-lactonase
MLGAAVVELRGGLRVNCRIEGRKGAPWVVMSNSHGTNLSLWDDLVPALAGRYQVLRYDQRGHGKTAPLPPPYAMTELVEDVVALLDHLGIARTHFIGISMGGATALGLALKHPQRLLSATLCDCSVGGARAGVNEWAERIAIAHLEGTAALVEPTIARWFTKESVAAQTEAVRKVAEMIRTTSVEGYEGCANALQTFDFSSGLEAIPLPCLLVSGAEDGPRPQTMEAMHRRIPGSQFCVIPQAGHLSNIENPAEFNRVVGAFLDSVPTTA